MRYRGRARGAHTLCLDAAKYCDSVNERATKNSFEKLVEDEEAHIDFLERQLDLIAQVGLQLYNQKHMGKLED